MVADGMTKALPKVRHIEFLKQLQVEDIRDRIAIKVLMGKTRDRLRERYRGPDDRPDLKLKLGFKGGQLGKAKTYTQAINIQIDCDNTQTINLVTAEIATLNTKLRHVDIHNHWLRQEIQGGKIQVNYAKSIDMVADRLIKVLPIGK